MIKLPPSKSGQAKKGVILSMVACLLLATLKCWIGTWAHSQAVFADGLNNFADLFLSGGILIALIVAGQPADKNHPFGHNKAENVAGLVAALVMVVVAFHVWIGSIQSLWNPEETTIHPLAIYLSLASAVVMFLISVVNFRLSENTNSHALEASAHDSRSDSYVSLGAAIGGGGTNLGYLWMDAVVAMFVGGIILHTAYKVGKPAIDALMDGFDEKKVPFLVERVSQVEGIREVRAVRARSHGPYVLVEVTVGVDEKMSVKESHDLTEKVEEQLKGFENIEHVHVHVEPIKLHEMVEKSRS